MYSHFKERYCFHLQGEWNISRGCDMKKMCQIHRMVWGSFANQFTCEPVHVPGFSGNDTDTVEHNPMGKDNAVFSHNWLHKPRVSHGRTQQWPSPLYNAQHSILTRKSRHINWHIRDAIKTELHSSINWEGEFSLSTPQKSQVHSLKETRHQEFPKNVRLPLLRLRNPYFNTDVHSTVNLKFRN